MGHEKIGNDESKKKTQSVAVYTFRSHAQSKMSKSKSICELLSLFDWFSTNITHSFRWYIFASIVCVSQPYFFRL